MKMNAGLTGAVAAVTVFSLAGYHSVFHSFQAHVQAK